MVNRYTSTEVCGILGITEMQLSRWLQTGHVLASFGAREPESGACYWSHADLYPMAAYRYLTHGCSMPAGTAERILVDSGALAELRDSLRVWTTNPILCAMHSGESIYSVLATDWVGAEDVRRQEEEWADVFGAAVKMDAVVCIDLGRIVDAVDRAVYRYYLSPSRNT